MFYNFRFTSKGLRFIGTSKKESLKEGVLSLTQSDLDHIITDNITNIKKFQEAIE